VAQRGWSTHLVEMVLLRKKRGGTVWIRIRGRRVARGKRRLDRLVERGLTTLSFVERIGTCVFCRAGLEIVPVRGELLNRERFLGCRDLDTIGAMRDLAVLLLHLLATVARLAGPGGARSVVAESVLVKHQLLILMHRGFLARGATDSPLCVKSA
jgi:hypothetical protein